MELIETTNLKEYRAAGGNEHSTENQGILGQLVDREVYHNLCQTMGLVQAVVSCHEADEYLGDEDEVHDLFRIPPDPDDVLSQNDLNIAKNSDGDWYWWKTGEPQPFVGLPAQYEVIEKSEIDFVIIDIEAGADSRVATGESREQAIQDFWGYHEGVSTFCDFEDAYRDALRCNGIGETEYESEVYEHWAVSSWLADKLKEHNETVGDLLDFHVWGRGCTGQAIKLDNVFAEIAAEMQILAGQARDWSKHE